MILAATGHVFYHHRGRRELVRPADAGPHHDRRRRGGVAGGGPGAAGAGGVATGEPHLQVAVKAQRGDLRPAEAQRRDAAGPVHVLHDAGDHGAVTARVIEHRQPQRHHQQPRERGAAGRQHAVPQSPVVDVVGILLFAGDGVEVLIIIICTIFSREMKVSTLLGRYLYAPDLSRLISVGGACPRHLPPDQRQRRRRAEQRLGRRRLPGAAADGGAARQRLSSRPERRATAKPVPTSPTAPIRIH